MRRFISGASIWTISGVLILVVAAWSLWSYVNSFQVVTFHFDSKLGYIELHSGDQPIFYPADNRPVKLKKGEYQIRSIGANIDIDQHKQAVDGATSDIIVPFNYSRSYLDEQYARERSNIETVLVTAYPKIATDYSIQHGKLYHQGEVYGAILVANQPGDNTDTLRVLMEKKDDVWVILSKPPVPILGSPLYPSIDRAILADINQAR